MHEFIIDKCELIEESITLIEFYTKGILEPNDFQKNDESLGKLDATMMRLQVKIQTFLSDNNETV